MAFDVAAVFREEFTRAIEREVSKSGFELDTWFQAGPRPVSYSIEKWMADGPGYVQNFIDWYESHEDIGVWITPNGAPAIELGIKTLFGEIPVQMYIDLVLDIKGTLVVVDLKSGAKAPDSLRQLAIYAGGVEQVYGIRPRYGAYFMHRGLTKKGETTYFQRPVPLDAPQYSVPYLTRELETFDLAVDAGIFLANPGDQCNRCSVAQACTEVGGDLARRYDRSHPEYEGGK